MIEADGSTRRPVAVIAFGGNALLRPSDHGTQEEQFTLAWKATRWLYEIIHRGYELAIIHGNGPQVGNIMIQVEEAITKIPPQSLDVCVAQTQGSMGYVLANQLRNRFNEEQLDKQIAAVMTEVVVDRDDPAFENPTKPIGKWRPDGTRRLVPSPQPVELLDERGLRLLLDGGALVVAAGGGGIPMVADDDGHLHGVEAVIDKDLCAELLARSVGATRLVILTDVEAVAVDWGLPTERALDDVTAAGLRGLIDADHFPAGSMGPKVEAATRFVERSGGTSAIGSLEQLAEVVAGTAGTQITA